MKNDNRPFDPVVDAMNEEEKKKLLEKVIKKGKRDKHDQEHLRDITLKD
jgi:hypothetical protein